MGGSPGAGRGRFSRSWTLESRGYPDWRKYLSIFCSRRCCRSLISFHPCHLFSYEWVPSPVWRYTPRIPGLGRLRQEDNEPEASLAFMVRPCLMKPKNNSSREEWILTVSGPTGQKFCRIPTDKGLDRQQSAKSPAPLASASGQREAGKQSWAHSKSKVALGCAP